MTVRKVYGLGVAAALVAALASSAVWAQAASAPLRSTAPSASSPAAAAPGKGPTGAYAEPKGDDLSFPRRQPTLVERDIAFEEGSAVLTTSAIKAITDAAKLMTPNTDVTIIGRDDPSLLQGLAENRANAIRGALQAAGISPQSITVRTSDEQRAANTQEQAINRAASRRRGAASAPAIKSMWSSSIRWRLYQSARVTLIEPTVAAAPAKPAASSPGDRAGARAEAAAVAAARQASSPSRPVGGLTATSAPAAAAAARAAAGPNVVTAAGAPNPAAAAPTPGSAGTPLATARVMPTSWEVRTSDVNVSQAMGRWARLAGVRLLWDSPRDFQIAAPDTFTGTFASAVEMLLSSAGIYNSDHPLEACLYANEPPLLRVTRQGAQDSDCTNR